MLGSGFEIILVSIVACCCCVLPGVFLVLRGMSMMTDAISHTVLLGITIGFFLSNNINSPLLMLFAVIIGLITVWLTELLYQTKLLSKDSAIGIVFPLFFSLAIILISKFAKNVHLDVEHVIFGEIAFIPFDRFETINYDFGPKALIILFLIFLFNLIIITLYYKELKLSTLDSEYSKVIGFSPLFLNYLLMSIVSITSVGTFQSIGVILVISFMTGPALTARLLTNKLSNMIIYSLIIGAISSVIGYLLATYFDVSISGMQATTIGVIFFLVLIFSSKKKLLKKY